jgi:hypothetical protein
MSNEKTPREKHNYEKLSILGSLEDVMRLSVTPDKSLQIRKAIIEAKKKDSSFDQAAPSYNTSFIWLEQNVPGYSRSEIVSTLVDMKGVDVTNSDEGVIEIPKMYFE